MTKPLLTLLIVGLSTLISFGQEGPTPESTPNVQPEALGPGDHTRTVSIGEQQRTYLIHVPKDFDPKKPAPVVLALHGAAMDGYMMVWFSGLNNKSDESGFIVIYPREFFCLGIRPAHIWWLWWQPHRVICRPINSPPKAPWRVSW